MKEKLQRLVFKTKQETGYIKMVARQDSENSYIIDMQYSLPKNGIKEVIKGSVKIVESIFKNKK
jgi:hypothetical protein